MTAEYQVHGDVAVITLNNPPVNGLGLSTRQAITAGLEKAENDAAVKAIVLTGAGKAFSGGADIREFNTPKSFDKPSLPEINEAQDAMKKPTTTVCLILGMILFQLQKGNRDQLLSLSHTPPH